MLANWVQLADESWEERVAGWLPARGVDALVVQREVLDPAEYVATWLRDAGEEGSPGYVDHYDTWLSPLEDAGVQGIGFGFGRRPAHRRGAPADPLDWPHPVEQPLGPHVDAWFGRQRWLAAHGDDDALSAAALVLADDVLQEQVGAPGAEDPAHLVLRQQVGLRRAAAGRHGHRCAGRCLRRAAPCGHTGRGRPQVLGAEPGTDAGSVAGALDRVRDLVEAGVLLPPV